MKDDARMEGRFEVRDERAVTCMECRRLIAAGDLHYHTRVQDALIPYQGGFFAFELRSELRDLYNTRDDAEGALPKILFFPVSCGWSPTAGLPRWRVPILDFSARTLDAGPNRSLDATAILARTKQKVPNELGLRRRVERLAYRARKSRQSNG